MTNPEHFNHFQQMCRDVLAQSGNCQDSQRAFAQATNVSELCQAWKGFWMGMTTEVPAQVLECFSLHYAQYRDEIRAAGIAYNEPLDMPNALIIVGSTATVPDVSPSVTNSASPSAITLHYDGYTPPRVYIIGAANVTLTGNIRAICNHPEAVMTLMDHTRGTLKQGTAVCRHWSVCTCDRQTVTHCHDSATIYANPGAEIHDHGHLRIYK